MVKDGHKRTEIGVIPEDWEVVALGDYVEINSGESPSKFDFCGQGIPYFKVEQLNNDQKYLSTTPYYFRAGKTVPAGSLIFPKRGASIMLNKIRVLENNSFMDTNLMTLTTKDGLDNEYLFYALNYRGLWQVADTTSIPQINNKHIRPFLIPYPNPEEQRAIASALASLDNMLAVLDTLIAKERAVKTTVMQELLTGRTRLPGFNEPWATRTFGECFQFLPTGSNSRRELSEDGEIGYIHYGDIHTKWRFVLDCNDEPISQINQEKVKQLPVLQDGDLIMADASEDEEGIGLSVEIKNVGERKIVAGLHTFLLRADKDLLADGFKAYITSMKPVKDALQRVATGTSVYGISKSNLREVEIPLPPTASEQRAIAEILEDMRLEIKKLEAWRDKVQRVKQGMMQELLTGRTRLV